VCSRWRRHNPRQYSLGPQEQSVGGRRVQEFIPFKIDCVRAPSAASTACNCRQPLFYCRCDVLKLENPCFLEHCFHVYALVRSSVQ
jgi:hypothetical protein